MNFRRQFHMEASNMDDRAAITQFMTLTAERHRDWNTVSLELIRAMTVFPKLL